MSASENNDPATALLQYLPAMTEYYHSSELLDITLQLSTNMTYMRAMNPIIT